MVDYNLELLRTFGLHFFPEGWSIAEIGDLLAHDNGLSVGVMYPGDNAPDGIPLIKAGDLKNNWVNPNPEFSISKEKHEEYRRTELLGGELLVSLVGNAGQTVVVPKEMCGWNVARAVAVLRPSEAVTPKYLQYCLQSPTLTSIIKAWCNTTVQETLNLKEIKKLPIPLPPNSEQHAIANILGALDDKIELNKKMNQTLEEIAKAIFRSWFVDFDPVRAKMEGRPTGLPPAIDELFPDELVDSEIGEIPKGWECVPISSLTHVMSRGIAPNYTDDETYPVINQKCIRNFDINFSLCKFTKYKKNIEQQFLKPFDTLVNSMGVGTLGRVSIFVDYEKSVIVDGLITVVRGITESDSLFLYQHLSSRETEIINLSTGSTGQTSLKAKDLGELKVVRPSQALLDVFANTTRDIYLKKRVCSIENNTLSDIRDLLLPNLISGELRIPDAEKFLEEAGI